MKFSMTECSSGSDNEDRPIRQCFVRLERFEFPSKTEKFQAEAKGSTNTEDLSDSEDVVSPKRLSKHAVGEKALRILSSHQKVKKESSECKSEAKRKLHSPDGLVTLPAKKTKIRHKSLSNCSSPGGYDSNKTFSKTVSLCCGNESELKKDLSQIQNHCHNNTSKISSTNCLKQSDVEGKTPSKNTSKLKLSEANWLGVPSDEGESLSKSKKKFRIPKKNSSSLSKDSASQNSTVCKNHTSVSRMSKKPNEGVLLESVEPDSGDLCTSVVKKTHKSIPMNTKLDQCMNTELNQPRLTHSDSWSTCSPGSAKHAVSGQGSSTDAWCISRQDSCIESSSSNTDISAQCNSTAEHTDQAAEHEEDLFLCVDLEPSEKLSDDSESEEEHSYKRRPRSKCQPLNQMETSSDKSLEPSRHAVVAPLKTSHTRKDLVNEIPQTHPVRNAVETCGHLGTDDRSTGRKRLLSPEFEENRNPRDVRAKVDESYPYSRSKEVVHKGDRDTINTVTKGNRKNQFDYHPRSSGHCHRYLQTGMCDWERCRFRHCPPGCSPENGERNTAYVDFLMRLWRQQVRYGGKFLPLLGEFCEARRLNLAFKFVHDHIQQQNNEVQSKAVLLLLSTSIDVKDESFVKCVIDFLKPDLLTIKFCSDFITICRKKPGVSSCACKHMFSLCEKQQIVLHEEAIVTLFEILENDWLQMLSLMTHVNFVCKRTVPTNIFEKVLRAVNEIKEPDLVSKMKSLMSSLDEDYLSEVDPFLRHRFEEYVETIESNPAACSANRSSNQISNVDKRTVREQIRNYVAQDRWIKVVQHFQRCVIEDRSGDFVEEINDAIFSHGELLGDKYAKFIREITGLREVNLFKKSLLGQLGVALVLEAHDNGLMKAAFKVLEAMHSHCINYMELQQSAIPESVKYAINVCVTYSWVALVVADVCVQADELADAVHILKDTSWANPSKDLNSDIRNHELSFRVRLLIKLSSALLKTDEFETGVEVMDVLLTSVTRDFKAVIHSSITAEIDELYSSYLVRLLNIRKPDPCVILWEHMSNLHCMVTLKPILLRSLIILWYPTHFTHAAKLFHQAVLRGLYSFDLPEQLLELHALTLPTYLSRAEFFLIFQLYVNHLFKLVEKTSPLSGSIKFPSISIILKEEPVAEKEPHLILVHELNCDISHSRKRFIREFQKLFEGIHFSRHYSSDVLHLTEDTLSSMFFKWKETQMMSSQPASGDSEISFSAPSETSSAFLGDKFVLNSKETRAFQKDMDDSHLVDLKFPTPPSSLKVSRSPSLSSDQDTYSRFHLIDGNPSVSPSSPVHHFPVSAAVQSRQLHKPQMSDNDECGEFSLPAACEFSCTSSSPKDFDMEDSASSRPSSPQCHSDDGEDTPRSPDPQNFHNAKIYTPKSNSSNKYQLSEDSRNSCFSAAERNSRVRPATSAVEEKSENSNPKFFSISKSGPANSTFNEAQKLNRPPIFGAGSECIESRKSSNIVQLKRSVTHTVNSAEATQTTRLNRDAVAAVHEKKYQKPFSHEEKPLLGPSYESSTESCTAMKKIIQFLKTKISLKCKMQPLELQSRAVHLCNLFLNTEESGEIIKLSKATMKRLQEFSQKYV